MASTDLSVGRMLAGAQSRAAAARLGRGRTRRDALARHLLELVLASPKARRTFARRIARIEADPFTPRPGSPGSLDLVAELATDTQGTARLGILTVVDGTVDPDTVERARTEIGPAPDSRLVVLVPKARSTAITAELAALPAADPRIIVATWARTGRRLAEKDPKRAELWQTLGEAGESIEPLTPAGALSPRVLIDEDVTIQMRRALDSFRLSAETLLGTGGHLITSRRTQGTALEAGITTNRLGMEFGPVHDGTLIRLVGRRPVRRIDPRIGILSESADVDRARRRLQALARHEDWRTDPAPHPQVGELIGEPATPRLEDARAVLWDVLDPRRFAAAGFPAVPRAQPALDGERLALRVNCPADEAAGTFLVSIGGSKRWKTLLPRVTREYDNKTYIVQVGRSDTTADLAASVLAALRSLATKP